MTRLGRPRSDTVRDRIKAKWGELSRSERAIAQHVLDTYPQAAFDTVHSLGEATSTSARSVMRFVQKLGYPGFPELQAELQADIEARLSSPAARLRSSAGIESADGVLEVLVANLAALEGMADEIDAVAGRLAKSRGRIWCFGAGKASAAASYLWHELALVRPGCHLLAGSDFEVLDPLLDAGPEDVVIVFDLRRYPRLGERVARLSREAGAHVLAITDGAMAPGAAAADEALVVRTGSQQLFDSYVAVFALLDLLVGRIVAVLGEAKVSRRLDVFEGVAAAVGVFADGSRR